MAWLEETRVAVRAGAAADPERALRMMEPGDRSRASAAAVAALATLPAPLDARATTPERLFLERVVGWARRLAGGQADALLAAERVAWLRGGDALVYLQRLRDHGDPAEADALARALVEAAPGEEAARVRRWLEAPDDLPGDWAARLEQVAAAPTREGVAGLFEGVDEARAEPLLRRVVERLEEAGHPPEEVFAVCSGVLGSAVLGLVERGGVSPDAVLERARRAAPEARPIWTGLAARAAWLADDRFRCLRLLRDARGEAAALGAPGLPPSAERIWEDADEAFRALMRRAGVAPE